MVGDEILRGELIVCFVYLSVGVFRPVACAFGLALFIFVFFSPLLLLIFIFCAASYSQFFLFFLFWGGRGGLCEGTTSFFMPFFL